MHESELQGRVAGTSRDRHGREFETSIPSAMHQAGASALTQVLQYPPPDEDHRTIPCSCGHSAHYKELRSKTLLTALVTVRLTRPYYLCAHCATGQYPVYEELDIAGLKSSPGVRRIEAVIGSEMPFTLGCEPMKVLAGLEVPGEAVERAAERNAERSAEAIGAQIAQRDEQEIARAKQLVLPLVSKQNIPEMYVLMDAVQVPVVITETEGRSGRTEGLAGSYARV